MLSGATLAFLRELREHNERNWFLAHRIEYETARAEFELLVDGLAARLASFDPAIAATLRPAGDYIFRIYRDTRFASDKSPYKTHFGAHVTAAARRSEVHSRAGYYLHIEPDGHSIIAGGAYRPPSPWLSRIRQHLAEKGDEFATIINSEPFTSHFTFEGESLKRPPRGFNRDTPHLDLILRKSFVAVHGLPDSLVLSGERLLDHSEKVCRALKPFDDFLNQTAS